MGIRHPVAYPYIYRPVNIKYTGPLGPNTRYAWFLPNGTDNDLLPGRLLRIDTFVDHQFNQSAKFFHVEIDALLNELGVKPAEFSTFAPKYCAEQSCAIMLAGSQNETAFITEHIRILSVRVQVLWLGDQLLRHVTKLLRGTNPLLFLLLARTPSEIVRRAGDFRSVAMPTYGGSLTPMQAGVYDLTPMAKYSSHNLLLPYIDALHFDGEEDWLLDKLADRILLETNQTRWQIYDEVACDWLNQIPNITDEKRKADLLDMMSINKYNLNTTASIGVIFPTGPMFDWLYYAADMAVKAINKADKLLPGMKLDLKVADKTDKPLMSFIKMSMNTNMLGVIGPDIKGITCKRKQVYTYMWVIVTIIVYLVLQILRNRHERQSCFTHPTVRIWIRKYRIMILTVSE